MVLSQFFWLIWVIFLCYAYIRGNIVIIIECEFLMIWNLSEYFVNIVSFRKQSIFFLFLVSKHQIGVFIRFENYEITLFLGGLFMLKTFKHQLHHIEREIFALFSLLSFHLILSPFLNFLFPYYFSFQKKKCILQQI